MKKFSLIVICFCFKISFAQNPAKLNLKDSCIVSGGVLMVADFKKVCKVCPEGMKKVTSYSISYIENHMSIAFPLKNNRWNSSFLKNAKLGTMLVIEDIKGVGANGKPVTAPIMTIGLK
ncbi:MAG: hypothetical protein IPJ32_14695 [Sphingobacteriaceae bacterium]|nr:hypothetical protein [Sphingobacteriaceae bacterium]